MIGDARGLFAADMAANLLAAFLLVLALLPYAEPPSFDARPAGPLKVASGSAFVDALHRRAVEGAASGDAVEIRDERDVAAACKETSEKGPSILFVLDPLRLPAIARSACSGFPGTRVLIIPASLKGPDGDWSAAVRRLFAAPLSPEDFRRALLMLLQGGDGTGIVDETSASWAFDTLRRRWSEFRAWGDFLVAAAMLSLLFRIRNTRIRGRS